MLIQLCELFDLAKSLPGLRLVKSGKIWNRLKQLLFSG
jgi:hypothetical protein